MHCSFGLDITALPFSSASTFRTSSGRFGAVLKEWDGFDETGPLHPPAGCPASGCPGRRHELRTRVRRPPHIGATPVTDHLLSPSENEESKSGLITISPASIALTGEAYLFSPKERSVLLNGQVNGDVFSKVPIEIIPFRDGEVKYATVSEWCIRLLAAGRASGNSHRPPMCRHRRFRRTAKVTGR
jgi:hypothetical protein